MAKAPPDTKPCISHEGLSRAVAVRPLTTPLNAPPAEPCVGQFSPGHAAILTALFIVGGEMANEPWTPFTPLDFYGPRCDKKVHTPTPPPGQTPQSMYDKLPYLKLPDGRKVSFAFAPQRLIAAPASSCLQPLDYDSARPRKRKSRGQLTTGTGRKRHRLA